MRIGGTITASIDRIIMIDYRDRNDGYKNDEQEYLCGAIPPAAQ